MSDDQDKDTDKATGPTSKNKHHKNYAQPILGAHALQKKEMMN
jgi:hypothetical protein